MLLGEVTTCDVCYTGVDCSFQKQCSVNIACMHGTVSPLRNCFLFVIGSRTLGFGLVICTRNWIPRPSSKIHCPVPNPANWYSFFALNTDETDENLATCSLFGEIQCCKGDSTSAIFIYGLHIFGIDRHIIAVFI